MGPIEANANWNSPYIDIAPDRFGECLILDDLIVTLSASLMKYIQ